VFRHVAPADLMEFGLIPELVGRLPVNAPLQHLDEDALLSILTEPKNALTRQYAKLMEMEDVKLTFEPGSLKEAVKIAMVRKTGARALRSIFEKAMLDVMYDVPSQPELAEVVITAETIRDGAKPRYITHAESKKAG
jgi:ATP-dependent Clp protease ATP-binding subunit ClpX